MAEPDSSASALHCALWLVAPSWGTAELGTRKDPGDPLSHGCLPPAGEEAKVLGPGSSSEVGAELSRALSAEPADTHEAR